DESKMNQLVPDLLMRCRQARQRRSAPVLGRSNTDLQPGSGKSCSQRQLWAFCARGRAMQLGFEFFETPKASCYTSPGQRPGQKSPKKILSAESASHHRPCGHSRFSPYKACQVGNSRFGLGHSAVVDPAELAVDMTTARQNSLRCFAGSEGAQ